MLINLHKGCKLNNIQVPSVSLDGEGQVEKVLVGWKRNVDGLLIERLTILIFEVCVVRCIHTFNNSNHLLLLAFNLTFNICFFRRIFSIISRFRINQLLL